MNKANYENFTNLGEVQNGHLYIRYKSSSKKNGAERWKRVTDYIRFLFMATCFL